MRLDPAPLCLLNDGGTLRNPPHASFGHPHKFLVCDVCGNMHTIELLADAIKSSWEALRLGFEPLEYRQSGNIRISLSFGKFGAEATAHPAGTLRWGGRC